MRPRKPREWTRGDTCMIERRDGPGPRLVVCIIACFGNLSGNPAARLVSVYPSGLDMWRRLTDLCTAQTLLLRRAIKALERERDELNNRRALVQFELDRRPTRR